MSDNAAITQVSTEKIELGELDISAPHQAPLLNKSTILMRSANIGRIVRWRELRLLDEVVVDPRIEESAKDLNDGAANR